jgi:hypothetical protein
MTSPVEQTNDDGHAVEYFDPIIGIQVGEGRSPATLEPTLLTWLDEKRTDHGCSFRCHPRSPTGSRTSFTIGLHEPAPSRSTPATQTPSLGFGWRVWWCAAPLTDGRPAESQRNRTGVRNSTTVEAGT